MLYLRAQSGHMLYGTIVEVRPPDGKAPDRASVRKSTTEVPPTVHLPSSRSL